MVALDLEGVEVSAGAACASGSLESSHVLQAMGRRPEIDGGGIRFSLGAGTTEAEIERVLELLPPLVERVRAAAPDQREPALISQGASHPYGS